MTKEAPSSIVKEMRLRKILAAMRNGVEQMLKNDSSAKIYFGENTKIVLNKKYYSIDIISEDAIYRIGFK